MILARPSPEIDILRALQLIGGVPGTLAPFDEVPLSIAAGICIEIDERHDDPAIADFVFGTAMDRPGGVIAARVVDGMTGDEMR